MEFFSGFFIPEDNAPVIVGALQSVTDRLAQGRSRLGLVCREAALTDSEYDKKTVKFSRPHS